MTLEWLKETHKVKSSKTQLSNCPIGVGRPMANSEMARRIARPLFLILHRAPAGSLTVKPQRTIGLYAGRATVDEGWAWWDILSIGAKVTDVIQNETAKSLTFRELRSGGRQAAQAGDLAASCADAGNH